jgi:hypothetical protein
VSIHTLDDDSLLHLFYLYRPPIFDGDEDEGDLITGGKGWDRELWWYKLAQVCQRWRNLIFGSASYLGLCLVCTHGTPIADMLAHSPPFPLVIDYIDENRDLTVEDEEGIALALEHRDRVRRIRLGIPDLQKLIIIMDGEYPVLEYLIMSPSDDEVTALMFPDTLQAPHLRQLALIDFTLPIGSQLLTTAVGIVTLSLFSTHPSTHFQLQWISFMPQLETLTIFFESPAPESQLMHVPNTTHVTLPNLRTFVFQGDSAYMEAVLHRITTPRLEKLGIQFFNQLAFSVPRLVQFINTTENLRFDSSEVKFSGDEVHMRVYREEDETYAVSISVFCRHLDLQVSLVNQFFNSRNQISRAVEHLTLEHEKHSRSSEEHNQVDRAEWHKLLMSFNHVKILRVDDGLVKELSRSLRPDDGLGELPPELLPELQELTYSGSDDTGDAFTPFIDARKSAGRPVTLIHLE